MSLAVRHYSTFVDGGAGRAARRLHDSLVRRGMDSTFVYSGVRNSDQATSPLGDDYQPARWGPVAKTAALSRRWGYTRQRHAMRQQSRGRPGGLDLFSLPRMPTITRRPVPDHVVHLHWVAKFIDWPTFFGSIPAGDPIVWTLHDMNAFSGGCHFAGNCDRFESGCGSCPQLGRGGPQDVSRDVWQIKREALRGHAIHVVAPSRWLIGQAARSGIWPSGTTFGHIPYSLNASEFMPPRNDEARDSIRKGLGIAPETFALAVGAMGLNNGRKGTRYLVDALRRLGPRRDVVVLAFGDGQLEVAPEEVPTIRSLGLIRDNDTLRRAYQAADAFVLPSVEDNLPLIGMEAMACGTPVIGFDAGGIPDYVREGVSGWLARTGDAADLHRCLVAAVGNRLAARRLGVGARELILREYATPIEADRYAALYRSIAPAADRRAA